MRAEITSAYFYARVEFDLRINEAIMSHTKSLCHPQGLSHCLFVSIAMMFPDELTEEAHCTLDKFMNALCLALAERYR